MKDEKKKSLAQLRLSSHLTKGHEIGLFYGFTPIAAPATLPTDHAAAKKISSGDIVVDSDNHEGGARISLDEKIALIRLGNEYNFAREAQPVMISSVQSDKADKKGKELRHTFDIIGTTRSIAEAILIQTAFALLSEAGVQDLHLEINSIGDKESIVRFTRELTGYYKKHLSELPTAEREKFKDDPFSILGSNDPKCVELAAECPKSINFLSEVSRTRFKETLEFIEAMNIPYEIKNSLVANRDYCTEIVFEVRTSDPKAHPLAVGIRYDTLARRLGEKKDIPGVSVSVAYPASAKSSLSKQKTQKLMSPTICFMQLGYEAKLKSLSVIEALREAGIPVSHSLARDKMAGQISVAEKTSAEYVIIMGQKEAVENSVIIRNNSNRSQETVFINEAAKYIKRHHIA